MKPCMGGAKKILAVTKEKPLRKLLEDVIANEMNISWRR